VTPAGRESKQTALCAAAPRQGCMSARRKRGMSCQTNSGALYKHEWYEFLCVFLYSFKD